MNNKPIRILMIEDDVVDVMAFKRMIKREQLNYNYQITDSIERAKQLIEEQLVKITGAAGTEKDIVSETYKRETITAAARSTKHTARQTKATLTYCATSGRLTMPVRIIK